MTEPIELPQIDEPPLIWLDPEVAELSFDEMDDGNRLGQTIDPDDDTDNGLG